MCEDSPPESTRTSKRCTKCCIDDGKENAAHHCTQDCLLFQTLFEIEAFNSLTAKMRFLLDKLRSHCVACTVFAKSSLVPRPMRGVRTCRAQPAIPVGAALEILSV
jgi:hypothetical protein